MIGSPAPRMFSLQWICNFIVTEILSCKKVVHPLAKHAKSVKDRHISLARGTSAWTWHKGLHKYINLSTQAIMTDHDAQFYANSKQLKEKGKSGFEKKLVELGIRQILAGVGHRPQTNGKLEHLYGEIQRKLPRFEAIMMWKSDPIDLFMKWYNCNRPVPELEYLRKAAQAFVRKMPPKGETVIDEQTGEEYNVK